MKKSIKRKFIDMLSPNNIDYIFFQHGLKLLISIMANMFIIEKAITIIVAILDLVNTCCEDPIHQMTCAVLFLMCIRIIIATAGPMSRKHINKGHTSKVKLMNWRMNYIELQMERRKKVRNFKKDYMMFCELRCMINNLITTIWNLKMKLEKKSALISW